jgi:methionyl-tRNA formyltransferase
MRVVFLGNHTVGVYALKALIETAEVVGVVAHPKDEEDGVRYESVYDFAVSKKLNVIRATGKSETLSNFITELKPDLIWIADYRYIIPQNIIAVPKLGAVNLHPSLLPAYRGRAVVNWAIINGETTLGLTAHFTDEGVDTGDIIDQVIFTITDKQNVGDALNILYPLYFTITQKVINEFINGTIKRMKQPKEGMVYPARKPMDGKINWDDTVENIYNLIRAVAYPYPGAFTHLENEKLTIWKAEKVPGGANDTGLPGTILNIAGDAFTVKCANGLLKINKFEFANPAKIKVGSVFNN